MNDRHQDPSSSWVINQAFFSMWVAFAAGVSVVGYFLVSPGMPMDSDAPAFAKVVEMPEPGFETLIAPIKNTDPAKCQLVLEVKSTPRRVSIEEEIGTKDPIDVAAEDIRVWLHRMGSTGSLDEMDMPRNAAGFFRAVDLQAGTYHITAIRENGALAAAPPWTCSGDGESGFRQLKFDESTHMVTGTIRGHQKVFPKNAELLLQQEEAFGSSFAGIAHVPMGSEKPPREEGNFRFRIPQGRYQLVGVAPHHAGVTEYLRITTDAKGKSQVNHLRFSLDWRPEVQGRVLDGSGQPVAGAEVYLGPMHDPKIGFTSVQTDKSGRYSLPILRAQTNLIVSARYGGGFGAANVPEVNAVEGISGIDVIVKRGREVQGFVQRQNGELKPHAEVVFRVREFGIFAMAKADAEGAFRISGLPKDFDVELWPHHSAIGAWGGAVASPDSSRVLLTYKAPSY